MILYAPCISYFCYGKSNYAITMIYNLSAIKSKMKQKPRGQRIYAFFEGDYAKLTPSQINQMEKIIAKGHESALAVIKKARSAMSAGN